MKTAGLTHLFKCDNLHNWWLTKYFLSHCMYQWAAERLFFSNLDRDLDLDLNQAAVAIQKSEALVRRQ